jgi:hypothetical protein
MIPESVSGCNPRAHAGRVPGLTKASLYPKALKAEGIDFTEFLRDQIALAERRVRK